MIVGNLEDPLRTKPQLMRICICLLLSLFCLPFVYSQEGASYLRDLEEKLEFLCEEFKVLNPAPNTRSVLQSRTLTHNPLTATYWIWNDVEKNWQLQHKEFCTYNPADQIIELINKAWTGNQWTDEYRAIFVYTVDNLLRLFQYENWEYNDWHLYTRYVNEYDEDDRLINVNLEDWIGKEWIVRSRKLHTYYVQPSCHKITDQLQDNHEWINEKRESYYFDAQQETKALVQESWNGVTWEKTSRQQYYYDEAYKVTSIVGQAWSADQWIDATQTTFLYDEFDQLITQEVKILQPSAGQQDFAWHLQYDNNHRLTETALWMKEGNTWNVKSRNLYTYDNLDRLLTNQSQVYQYAWINADYISYTYKELTPVENHTTEIQFSIHPNPASNLLCIRLPKELPEATLQVIDMNGKIISTSMISPSKEIDLDISQYPAGQYAIQILTTRERVVRNFTKG